jgi:multisubunit Na+/H+ antiporter MnhB subunit
MNPIAIVSSLIIIIGCFLPWIQLGALLQNRGIDNPDGAIMLLSAVVSGAVAIYNQSKNLTSNKWVYIVVGIIGILVAYYGLTEVHSRADKIQEGIGQMSDLFGESKEVSKMNFIGSGLYIVCVGSIGLLLCGLGVFSARTVSQTDTEVKPTEIVAPKYAKKVEQVKTEEEIENEKYRSGLTKLNQLIKVQKDKLFGGGMTDEIMSHIENLCHTQDDAIYLLNSYQTVFRSDLIDELKKLNSSYDAIKTNVSKFIELGIIEDKYPHNPL